VDIDERTYTMDPEKLRRYLEDECTRDRRTNRTVNKRTGKPVAAVVPVHLYGQMAEMDAILELANQYNLIVIEDACQAHGAEYFSKKEGLAESGFYGPSRSIQLLSGEKLGCVWRSRAPRRTMRTWHDAAGCCAIMAKRRNTIMTSRATMEGLMPYRLAF
jgi:hypothetical protein